MPLIVDLHNILQCFSLFHSFKIPEASHNAMRIYSLQIAPLITSMRAAIAVIAL
jgi:hypothetical protein